MDAFIHPHGQDWNAMLWMARGHNIAFDDSADGCFMFISSAKLFWLRPINRFIIDPKVRMVDWISCVEIAKGKNQMHCN